MSYAYHILSNVEREKLVIDLYYNQRKNVRQIAQETRISFRDIAAIIKKKEAAAVNDVGSGNANGIGVDNQQQQQQQNIVTITINLPMKKPHKLTNSIAKEINL
jgi:hypothetical protein